MPTRDGGEAVMGPQVLHDTGREVKRVVHETVTRHERALPAPGKYSLT